MEPEAEDDACVCTPRSTDSDEYRDASSVVDAWKTAFQRMKFQMNSTLDVAMLSRRENREKVGPAWRRTLPAPPRPHAELGVPAENPGLARLRVKIAILGHNAPNWASPSTHK